MANAFLAIYLNDHLAGSSLVIEILEHLESTHGGDAITEFCSKLRADILADRRELEELMKHLGISQSAPRKMGVWIAEKFVRIKLNVEDAATGQFRLLEAMDLSATGIQGKRALWEALKEAAPMKPELGFLDYDRLIRRAEDQHQRVETVRLDAAKEALGRGK